MIITFWYTRCCYLGTKIPIMIFNMILRPGKDGDFSKVL